MSKSIISTFQFYGAIGTPSKNAYEVIHSEMITFIERVSDNWGVDNADRQINDKGEYIDCCVREL